MRRLLAGLTLSLALVATASAQQALGTYTMMPPGGKPLTFVLQKDAAGKITGSLSGNGASFQVTDAKMDGEDVVGTLSGNGLKSYFEAGREGANLHVLMADIGPDGRPDLLRARELVMSPAPAGASVAAQAGSAASPAVANDGNSPARGAAGAAPAASALAKAPQDQQIVTLLLSTAWCSFSYSGGSTYTGGSAGTTRTSRAVFSPDGGVRETSNSETTSSGAPGNTYGSNTAGQSARWRIENGMLMLSADGVQWAPQVMKIADNGSGAPIVTVGGKEYMRCR